MDITTEEYAKKIEKDAITLANDIKDLIEHLGKKKGYETNFEVWIKRNYTGDDKYNNGRGFTYSNMKEIEKKLRSNFSIIENNSGNKNYSAYRGFVFEELPIVKRAKQFKELAEKYKPKKTTSTKTHERVWYVYYLETGNPRNGYPKLGRALLKLTSGGKATMTVPNNKYEVDYTGDFKQINRNVSFFDLDVIETDLNNNQNLKKRLHIKIHYGRLDDQIILGCYNTYDDKIYAGLSVLEKVKGVKNKTDEDLLSKVMYLSVKENPEEFNNVNECIRDYLTLKEKNLIKVPKDIIKNLGELETFLKGNESSKDAERLTENRFLELDRPIVFFAFPQSSLASSENLHRTKALVYGIVIKLWIEYNKYYDIRLEGVVLKDLIIKYVKLELGVKKEDVKQEDLEKLKGIKLEDIINKLIHDFSLEDLKGNTDTDPLKTLRTIGKTRYFVLLYPKTEKLSFSVIQMGWALNVSKNILFLFERDTTSIRLEQLVKVNTNFEYHNREFDKERGIIYEDICRFMEVEKLTE